MSEAPVVTVLIAVLNEAENVEAVNAETLAAFDKGPPFEILYVDDGSTDATPSLLKTLTQQDSRVRAVRHDRRCGKSAALRTGVMASRGDWIATLDGDGQNDPVDLAAMTALAIRAEGTPPLVAGIRVKRHDDVSRLVATKFANGLRSWLLGDNCPDTGCGMKVFPRKDFLMLPVFEGLHRFFPALFKVYGLPLVCYPVSHRARMKGVSKYTNLGRAFVGVFDLMGVIWLIRRTRTPGKITDIEP
ncbi:MAG: glycosyltransferase family 2 protein [Caulobacteraceae bacterium]